MKNASDQTPHVGRKGPARALPHLDPAAFEERLWRAGHRSGRPRNPAPEADDGSGRTPRS